MPITRRTTAAVATLMLTLLALALPVGRAAAAPTNLNVALSIGNSPAWGDPLEVTMTTNYPAAEGVLVLSRVNTDGSLTPLLTTDTEGRATVDTGTHLPPGSHQLVATAMKEGVEKESPVRTATVTKRPTTVTFLNTTSEPQGDIKVQIGSAGTGFVPTGSVVFSADGMVTTTVNTDSRGVATLSRPPVGTRALSAAYQGTTAYAASSETTDVTVNGYRATLSGTLSRGVIAAGDEVSIDLTISTGDTGQGLPSGGWMLLAGQEGSTHMLTAARGHYSGTGALTVDLTEWARAHEGTWTLKLQYAGNLYVYAASQEVATLTVGPADQRPATTTIVESPAGGVMAGGQLVVLVGSANGQPSGAVVLLTGSDTVVTSGTVTDGVAHLTVPRSMVPGVHQFRAAYAGSAAHQGSTSAPTAVTVLPYRTGTRVEIVAPDGPVELGGEVRVLVRSSDGAAAGVSGPVQLEDLDEEIIATGTAVDGVATLTLGSAVSAGEWALRASFLGTETHAPSESAVTRILVVDPAAQADTTTAIVVPGPGVPRGGELAVTVSSTTGTPAGPVTLHRADGTVLATGTVTNGQARLRLPIGVVPGVHQLRAAYGGSATHRASQSVLTAVTVAAPAQAPSTKAASAVRGKVIGKRGKAVVTVAVAAAVPVSGSVEVRDGKRLVRTAALAGGKARLTLKNLRKGKHRITVTYGGSTTVARSQRTFTVRVR